MQWKQGLCLFCRMLYLQCLEQCLVHKIFLEVSKWMTQIWTFMHFLSSKNLLSLFPPKALFKFSLLHILSISFFYCYFYGVDSGERGYKWVCFVSSLEPECSDSWFWSAGSSLRVNGFGWSLEGYIVEFSILKRMK